MSDSEKSQTTVFEEELTNCILGHTDPSVSIPAVPESPPPVVPEPVTAPEK